MEIGDKIAFGKFSWNVLDIQNDTALIITENIIEQRSYHDVYREITWADCSLRKYLNGEFYDRFTEAERARIVPEINQNPDNPWYGSEGGADTRDSIFLLSLEETVCRYFGDSSANLQNRSAKQRYWFQKKDPNNSKRVPTKESEWYWWWLRTPGRVNKKAVYLHPDGNIGIQGNNIFKGNLDEGECKGGIRPALWLKR